MSKFLQNAGLAAIAAALAVTALPASAQDRGRGRWQNDDANAEQNNQRAEQRSEQRAARVQQRSEQRAAQVQQRSEQRAAQVEWQGDRAAAQAAQRGNWDQARQIDRRTEQVARPVEQRGDWRANRVERQGDQRRGDAVAARGDWRGNQPAQVQTQQRNRTYVDPNRNTTYGRTAEYRRDSDSQWRDGRRDNNTYQSRNGTYAYRDSDYRGDYRRWDRTWRNNNRYDWHRYRSTNRIVFNIGTYYSPYRNYSYRRWGIGSYMDSLFFGSRYWISDPWQYRLPAVYGPYRWVRYYDDVLLVDIYSGEVVDVIYDFFW